MREILFRGKREDNDEWVFGFLCQMWGAWHIMDENDENIAFPVDSETVGQYTGLKDKSGKKIFEGDIIQYQPEYELRPLRSYVVYDGEAHNYPAFDLWSHEFEANGLQCAHEDCRCEVVGNRWDNPELLKEENDDENE